jgi:hypothetical protein
MSLTRTEVSRQYELALAMKEQAALALYQAEIALHDAHQTRVDDWITAAADHLHLAVVRYVTLQQAVDAYRVAAAAA